MRILNKKKQVENDMGAGIICRFNRKSMQAADLI